MKFNCGPGFRLLCKQRALWHRWFAWHPVRVGDYDCRWLETIARRGEWHFDSGGGGWVYEYRALGSGGELPRD